MAFVDLIDVEMLFVFIVLTLRESSGTLHIWNLLGRIPSQEDLLLSAPWVHQARSSFPTSSNRDFDRDRRTSLVYELGLLKACPRRDDWSSLFLYVFCGITLCHRKSFHSTVWQLPLLVERRRLALLQAIPVLSILQRKKRSNQPQEHAQGLISQ